MLVNLNDVLLPAAEKGYGVGLFNTVNFEMARGVLQAAQELRAPVIIGTAEILLPYRTTGRAFRYDSSDGEKGRCAGRGALRSWSDL